MRQKTAAASESRIHVMNCKIARALDEKTERSSKLVRNRCALTPTKGSSRNRRHLSPLVCISVVATIHVGLLTPLARAGDVLTQRYDNAPVPVA